MLGNLFIRNFFTRERIIQLFIFCRISGLLLSLFFLGGIIYYFRQLKIFSHWREKWRRKWGLSSLSDLFSKSNRKWKKIDRLLEEPYPASWKLAVLQGEGIVEEALKQIGLPGDDFSQQLQELQKQGYRHLDILSELHQRREKILKDKNFSLSLAQAKEAVAIYKTFWKEIIDSLG